MRQSLQSIWSLRDFRLVIVGGTVSSVGDGVTELALLLRVHDSGVGPSGIALLLGVVAGATVLIAPLSGRLVDSLDSRQLVVATSAVSALAVLGLARGGPLWQSYLLVFALEAAQAVGSPAWSAVTPRIVGRERAAVAASWTQSCTNGARIAGPLLGGTLVGLAGLRTAFLADAITFGVIAVASCFIRTRRHLSAEATARTPGGGLRLLRNDPVLWPALLALIAFLLGGEAVNVLDVFLVRDSLHASDTGYGLISALVGTGLILGSLAATRLRTARQRTFAFVVSLTALALLMVAEGLAPDLAALAVLTVVTGLANGLLNSSFGGLVIDRTDDAVRGRVGASINALCRSAALLALALGAAIGAVTGPRTGFVLFGVLSAAAVVVLAPKLLRQGVLGSPHASALALPEGPQGIDREPSRVPDDGVGDRVLHRQ